MEKGIKSLKEMDTQSPISYTRLEKCKNKLYFSGGSKEQPFSKPIRNSMTIEPPAPLRASKATIEVRSKGSYSRTKAIRMIEF